MFVKYKKITILSLFALTFFLVTVGIDLCILPKTKFDDTITHYSKLKAKRSTIGYKFFTKKGHSFSTDMAFIDAHEVEIEQTKIFKNITCIKANDFDYTKILVSDLNGITIYLYLMLHTSSLISLFILKLKRSLTENNFLNIVLMNFTLIFFITILYFYF